MKMLPIAVRELRVASRRRGTYWSRSAAAGLAMGTATLILTGMMHDNPTEQSRVLFFVLGALAAVYALLSGALTTADCVSEEKREGTLGLLFLTTLRGHDVVIGKMAASSLRAIGALVAILPVMAFPLLMGAIGPGMVSQVALAVLNTMFLSLALGVLVSVLTRDARSAVGGALLVLMLLVVGVPVLRVVWIEYVLIDLLHWYQPAPGRTEPLEWLHLGNPAMLYWWAASGVYRGGGAQPQCATALALQHGLAWAALVAACVLAPRTWRDRAENRVRRAGGESGSPGAAERAMHLEPRPFAWMVARERKPVWHTWAGLVVIAGVWIWGYFELREDWLHPPMVLITLGLAGTWLKLRLAGMACRHLHEHRRSGALELLLCTPETPASLVAGNLAGLRTALAWPLAATLGFSLLLLVAVVRHDAAGADLPELLLAFVVVAAVLLLDLWAIAWAGIWRGLRQPKYVRAVASTVGWVLGMPWLIFIGGGIGLAVANEIVPLAFDPDFTGVALSWFLVAAAIDAFLLIRARQGLSRHFRELAAEHYGTPGAAPARTGMAAAPAASA